MTADDSATGQSGRRPAPWLAALLAILFLTALALWALRAPIADNFIERELNRRGVPARYDIVDIGLRTQRLENVVIGDPKRPDLIAKWVEVDIGYAGIAPAVAGVRAGGLTVRGAIRDGALHLGALDKFRDPTSKDPLSLPDIDVGLEHAKLLLATPGGDVAADLSGDGNLRSGFSGRLLAAIPVARFGACAGIGNSADLRLSTSEGRPTINGPITARAFGCPNAGLAFAAPRVQMNAILAPDLAGWRGQAALSSVAAKGGGGYFASPDLRVSFDGTRAATRGELRMALARLRMAALRTGPAIVSGRYQVEQGAALSLKADGTLSARDIAGEGRDPLRGMKAMAVGTPLEPLAIKLAQALERAARGNEAAARWSVAMAGERGQATLAALSLTSRSGASVRQGDDGRLSYAWPAGHVTVDGGLSVQGGGMPDVAVRLTRGDVRRGVSGQIFLGDYDAPGARLSAEPLRFVAIPGGESRFSGAIRLDGPIGRDGAVRGLSIPLAGTVGADGFTLGAGCTPMSVESLRYSGLSLNPARLRLCPVQGNALVVSGPRGLNGGATLAAPRLSGRIGSSPALLTAARATFRLGSRDFSVDGLDARIGRDEAPFRLTLGRLNGRSDRGVFSGRFSEGSSRIGNVPLDLTRAAADWRFADGALSVKGGLSVADTAATARFNMLESRDVTLTLANGRAITATGTLVEPKSGRMVSTVRIAHDLSSGAGKADLGITDLRFDEGFQPDAITPVTLGVVANVQGRVEGEGHIRWTAQGVTSDGRFSTSNANLAAAFGPVTGLTGTIVFDDLLGLTTPPGQVATIKSVNPGIEATDGTVRYQLLPEQRVSVEEGKWPFAGGELTLLPTTLDFSAEKARNLSFRVIGLQAADFIQKLELKDISATGTFDGLLPMVFDDQGGRIVGGILVARQEGAQPLYITRVAELSVPCDPARQAGTLAYVGDVSNAELGAYGKLAFDALKSLRYKCLTILMDGQIDGEVVTQVSFNGVNQGTSEVAKSGFFKEFIGLPFIFNIRIAAPFRGLLGTAQSFVDPSLLIRNSVNGQYQPVIEKDGAVQPAESGTVRQGTDK